MKKIVKPLKTVYEQNNRTKITVTNKPVYDGEALLGYEPKVNVEVKVDYNPGKPFEFANDDAIADFIGEIDTEDPQTELGV